MTSQRPRTPRVVRAVKPDMDHTTLTNRIVATRNLMDTVDDAAIDPRLRTLIRKALKTALLADVHALSAPPEEENDARPN